MKKKLFVSDIDGTLLKTGTAVHPAVLRGIQRFCQAGGQFSLCTGRALPAVRCLETVLPYCSVCILCSGALLYDPQKDTIIESTPLNSTILSSLERILALEPTVSITVSTENGIFRIRDNPCLLQKGVPEDRTAPKATLSQLAPVVKVLFTCEQPETLERLPETYWDPKQFTLHRASTHFYELTAGGVSKGSGIQRLKSITGCDTVLCAGDAPSDLQMAKEADAFFAPESAMHSVKAHADYIFPAPVQGGLSLALAYAEQWNKDEKKGAVRYETSP